MRAKICSLNVNTDRGGIAGFFRFDWVFVERQTEKSRELAGDADVGEAVATIAGNFDIKDRIGPVRFDGFDRKTSAGEGICRGLGGWGPL
jgi:hypothetical protein